MDPLDPGLERTGGGRMESADGVVDDDFEEGIDFLSGLAG